MYTSFSDLLSQAVCVSCLAVMGLLALIPATNIVLRHKRRIVNMIEGLAHEFTS